MQSIQRFTLACGILWAGLAEARFQHEDARFVDREERQDRATWHDGSVYRYYPRLEELWRAHDLGYRISDGSYDADRSRIQEQLKLTSPADDALVLSYKHERLHDLAEEIIDDELRFTARVGAFYGAVMADGDTSYKQWGDVGAAFGYRARRRVEAEIYVWSVDHFYESKQEIDLGHYATKTKTYGARLVADRDAQTGVELRYEVDTPLSWERTFDGAATDYVYGYRHDRLDLAARLELTRGWQLLATALADDKSESKDWAPVGAAAYAKSLTRRALHVDASVLWRRDDAASDQLGILNVERRGAAAFVAPVADDDDRFDERPSPDSRRHEWQGYFFHQLPLAAPRDGTPGQFLQLGYTQSWARHEFVLDPDAARFFDDPAPQSSSERGFDQKFQLAFELYFAKDVGAFLNATLDVDGIRKDFPFERGSTPGNLWDGGGVQFFALF